MMRLMKNIFFGASVGIAGVPSSVVVVHAEAQGNIIEGGLASGMEMDDGSKGIEIKNKFSKSLRGLLLTPEERRSRISAIQAQVAVYRGQVDDTVKAVDQARGVFNSNRNVENRRLLFAALNNRKSKLEIFRMYLQGAQAEFQSLGYKEASTESRTSLASSITLLCNSSRFRVSARTPRAIVTIIIARRTQSLWIRS